MNLLFAFITLVVVALLIAMHNIKENIEKPQALLNIAISMSSMICFYALHEILKWLFL